jgi:hypothetical protein
MNTKSLLLLSLAACSSQAYAQVAPSVPSTKTPLPLVNSLRIRDLSVRDIHIFQLEVQRQSVGDVLEAIAAAADIRVVVDPVLKDHHFLSLNMNSLTLEDLLVQVSKTDARVEMWKSTSGTYFFAETPAGNITKPMLEQIQPKLAPDRERDPFVIPAIPYKKFEPKSHWGIIPFNGHDIYVLPLPSTPRSK